MKSALPRIGFWPVAIFVLFTGIAAPADAASKVFGATVYTTFWVNGTKTGISWITCGSTQQSEGCFSSGTMSPFTRVCAVLESEPVVNGNAMTHKIYVLDSGTGRGTSLRLDVFKQTDTTTADYDTTRIALARSVTLPIAGGGHASCSMAADVGFLFVGTSTSPNALRIAKTDLSVFTYGSFEPPIPVSQITADEEGYVVIDYADPAGSETGFILIGPDGSTLGDGGGNSFFPNSRNAYLPK